MLSNEWTDRDVTDDCLVLIFVDESSDDTVQRSDDRMWAGERSPKRRGRGRGSPSTLYWGWTLIILLVSMETKAVVALNMWWSVVVLISIVSVGKNTLKRTHGTIKSIITSPLS